MGQHNNITNFNIDLKRLIVEIIPNGGVIFIIPNDGVIFIIPNGGVIFELF